MNGTPIRPETKKQRGEKSMNIKIIVAVFGSLIPLSFATGIEKKAANTAAAEDKIRVRADVWCPYNCATNDKLPGYMVEVLQAIFGKKNVDYSTMTWSDAVRKTRKSEFDAVIGATKQDTPDFFFPKESLGFNQNCFYTKIGNKWKYDGAESFKNLKSLGVTKDYTYFAALDELIKKEHEAKNKQKNIVKEYLDAAALKDMITDVREGKIDAMIENPNVMSYLTKSSLSSMKIHEADCMVGTPLYVAFAPDHPKSIERAQKLGNGIKKMIKNGEMKKILNKYHLKPWF